MTEIKFNETIKEINWNGEKLKISTGKMARQADAAVVVEMGKTLLLCTVVGEKKAAEGIDFLPLTVEYQEKAYGAGKIPGGFFKREGKASKREVLTARMIDRPIRPLFSEGFFNEVQVVCTVLSYDPNHEPDVLATIAASAALAISGIPFSEVVACARVGYINGKFVLNPSLAALKDSELDLVVSGTESSVLMVESKSKELSEEIMLEAVMFGHSEFQPVIEMIKELKAEIGKEAWTIVKPDLSDLTAAMEAKCTKELNEIYSNPNKSFRRDALASLKASVLTDFVTTQNTTETQVISCLKALEEKIVRHKVMQKKRIDGRGPDQIRPISCEVGVLPQPHGSALFTRGETQALVVTTLGTTQDEQIIDDITGNTTKKIMLDYNFPGFSVGEISRARAPGRREIGHGALAEKALDAVLPTDFPYTIRIVSEILESNGSSSMATVCGGSLAAMDAGIPIKDAVAGIAMGLVKEGDDYVVLSDIMGDEDHLGDMDFKVAGTTSGITALQMDIKINGITKDIMETALEKAKDGRLHILKIMAKTLTESREELHASAPRITTIKIDKEKIRDIIGSGGKVIRELCEKSNSKIDITDDGTIKIAATSEKDTETALSLIADILAVPELGKVYTGKVVKITDFGAFVNYMGNLEGLLHISEMSEERIESVSDVLSEGQEVVVKLTAIDRTGKVRLSMNLDAPIVEGDSGGRPSGGGGRGGRPERGNRSGGDRDRGRSEGRRPDRFDRERSGGGRSERSDRPARPRFDRPERTERPDRDRFDRPDRKESRDRSERDSRGGGERSGSRSWAPKAPRNEEYNDRERGNYRDSNSERGPRRGESVPKRKKLF